MKVKVAILIALEEALKGKYSTDIKERIKKVKAKRGTKV